MNIIKKIITKKVITLDKPITNIAKPSVIQTEVLRKLLYKAKNTEFGKKYHFRSILLQKNEIQSYQKIVPIFTYEKFYQDWIIYMLKDIPNVTWPGVIKYYALSSGTTQGSSKFLPISKAFIKSCSRNTKNIFYNIYKRGRLNNIFTKDILTVGGSSLLVNDKNHFLGDLSGILSRKAPFWLKSFVKPKKKVNHILDWDKRIDQIIKLAKNWDIGTIVGNIAWVSLLSDKLISYYKVKSIHEIWPNFSLLITSGIAPTSYIPFYNKKLLRDITYVDTYMASEGFFGFQTEENSNDHQLIINNGIFYEFLEVNSQNYDQNGNISSSAKTTSISNLELNKEYSLIISTNAGLWRYHIGDTIKFNNLTRLSYRLVGRTKQNLNNCGEHLSIDEINIAISNSSKRFQVDIIEFCVMPIQNENCWIHYWYIAMKPTTSSTKNKFTSILDEELIKLNDDYRTQRINNLLNINVQIIDIEIFYDWLKYCGKKTGQAKIPRILSDKSKESWMQYMKNTKLKFEELI